MKAAAEEKVTAPIVSNECEKELKDELLDLDEQERRAIEILGETQAALTRIRESRLVLMQELLDGEFVQPDALELTPAMANEAIAALKAEFDKGAKGAQEAGYKVQEGIDFSAVEAKLRAEENEGQLKAVYRMVQAGSRPAVVCEEGGRFCIAETFGQTLSARANCVYDRQAQKQVGLENCNGNAVDQAQKMGVPLMERRIAEAYIAAFPDSNQQCCYDYIQSTEDEKERGRAYFVHRSFGRAGVDFFSANYYFGNRGWRGALWV